MGAYEGARICELWAACYYTASTLIPATMAFIQLLLLADNCTPRKANVIRKKLHWLFNKFEFKLDIQTDLLVGWVLWYIHLFRLFNAKSIFMTIVLFQTISTQFKCKYSL